MSRTILVVDDKSSVRLMLRDVLTEEGFRVVTAEDGQQALYAARQEKPDLILLDLMMPNMNGLDFIRTYRREQNTPIILLTARMEESDKVVGLELGADDYITKPFSMRELTARIRAVLRRTGGESGAALSDVLRCGGLSLDRASHEVILDGQKVSLTPSEFDLLDVLMTSPGRVYSRLELLERLQGTSFEGVARTIDVHVRNLRSKIDPDAANPRFIETVFGVGYRFKPEERSL